jgi:uncharacterized protein YoxC
MTARTFASRRLTSAWSVTYAAPVHPVAQAIIVVCVVAVSAALVYTLLSVRETAQRAASVLGLVEREIRPLATQLEALAEDLRGLSRQVTREVDRVSVVVRRIEEVSLAVVRLAGAVSAVTSLGRMVGVAAGLKKGFDVFASRLLKRR